MSDPREPLRSGLTFGSVCSGIEAASVAWKPLGWRCAFMSEIEAFPRAALAHHYPETPLHGDFTTIQAGQYEPIDLLVGGTPCQSFSVAGLRGGLDDDRGNLALEYLRLADRLRPKWLVWENVPGVLSSNGGRDFGSILGGMVQLGYGVAYRVLDAQYFGLAQRRRRVFVVGYSGDWRRAAAVLFERHSLSGNPAPSRETGEGTSASPASGFDGGGEALARRLRARANASHRGDSDTYIPVVSPALKRRDYKGPSSDGDGDGDGDGAPLIAHALRGTGFDASEDGTGRGTPIVPVAFMSNASGQNLSFGHDLSPTLRIGGDGGNAMAVAFTTEQTPKFSEGVALTLTKQSPTGGGQPQCVMDSPAVRRLTPRECERLQGFPDDYTAIPYRGKPASDGPRYKALGNSMAVPVMAWIGRRITEVEALTSLMETT